MMNYHDARLKGRIVYRKPKFNAVNPPPLKSQWVRLNTEQSVLVIAARKAAGFSQSEVARMYDMDTTHFSRFERGFADRGMRREMFSSFLSFLKIDEQAIRLVPEQVIERAAKAVVLPRRQRYAKMGRGRMKIGAPRTRIKELPPPVLTYHRADILRYAVMKSKQSLIEIMRKAHVSRYALMAAFMGDPVKDEVLTRICEGVGISLENIRS